MQALLKYLLTGNFRATAGSTKNKSLVKTASDKSKLVQRESRNYSVCIPLQKWQHPLNILHNMSPIEQEFWTDCVKNGIMRKHFQHAVSTAPELVMLVCWATNYSAATGLFSVTLLQTFEHIAVTLVTQWHRKVTVQFSFRDSGFFTQISVHYKSYTCKVCRIKSIGMHRCTLLSILTY